MIAKAETIDSFEAARKTPLQKFDHLASSLKHYVIDGREMGTGVGTTPLLPTESGPAHFLFFKPRRIPGQKALYSPSILWQQFPKRKSRGSGFLAPNSKIYLRRSHLKSGFGIESLDKLEAAFLEYEAVAHGLPLEAMKRLFFPRAFLKREALRRGEGSALASLSLRQTSRIVES
jgi:DNA-dependent RNA polymerase auxiliary subunit epsilon